MKLAQWIDRNGNADAVLRLARRIPCERSSVYKFRNGRVPNKAAMSEIYVETAGTVCPDDFFDLPPLSRTARRARDTEILLTLARKLLGPAAEKRLAGQLTKKNGDA